MFKNFDPSRDIRQRTTPINELIVIDRSIFTGTAAVGETNIKNFVHWTSGAVSGTLFQTLYNTNYTSASAVALANITYGQSISSSYYLNALATNKQEKSKIYRLFAKYLLGDEDQLFSISGSSKNELIFLSVARSQMKDELKKQTFTLDSTFSGSRTSRATSKTFQDTSAASAYNQSIRGDFAPLYSGSQIGGLLYYQAGIAVLVPEIFSNTSSQATNPGNIWSGTADYDTLAMSGNYNDLLNGVRYRFTNLSLINQSNLQASFYYCRMLNDEFNYSSNPSFVDTSGRILTTSGSTNYGATTYTTKIALLDENNSILAVASLNQPIKKDPSIEQLISVRIDY